MSSKEEKPTLAGVNVKTRKRNIAVPLDPGSFANEVIQIFTDNAKEGASLQDKLDAGLNVLDTSRLDFNRYGDTLFEILFAGGRMLAGANVDANGKRIDFNLLASDATHEAIFPYIKTFQALVRRRPFLIKNLENVLVKLLTSLEFYDENGRAKLAIATALIYGPTMKIGILPENVFGALRTDRLVQKGTILEFVTIFFEEYLSMHSMDDLVSILTKAKVATRLFEFFPPQMRNTTSFADHFNKKGMQALVEWHNKKAVEIKMGELKQALSERFEDDEPSELLEFVREKAQEGELPDAEVIKVVWDVLVRSINMAGKNPQQLVQVIGRTIIKYKELLAAYCTSARLEAALLVTVQVHCYEDSRILKIFSDIVRVLYDLDLVGEDTILYWYRKGSHPKGRNVFLKDIEPFIQWLEEAEEEDEDDDDDE